MGIGSITLGALSFLCMVGGIFLVWVPFLGAMLGFLAPVLALFGVVLGGVALSRAREGGHENESLAIGGLVTRIIAFIPSTLVAITCSMCSACWTSVVLTPHDAGPRVVFPDAGVITWAPPNAPTPPAWPPIAPPPIAPPPIAPPPIAPPPIGPPGTPAVDPTADPAMDPAADPAASPPTTDPATPTTAAPGSSGPALPPPPLPPGPNVRSH